MFSWRGTGLHPQKVMIVTMTLVVPLQEWLFPMKTSHFTRIYCFRKKSKLNWYIKNGIWNWKENHTKLINFPRDQSLSDFLQNFHVSRFLKVNLRDLSKLYGWQYTVTIWRHRFCSYTWRKYLYTTYNAKFILINFSACWSSSTVKLLYQDSAYLCKFHHICFFFQF